VQNVKFRERLYPPLGLFIALLLGYPMVFLAAIPFGTQVAFIAAALLPSAVIAAVYMFSPELVVADQLHAGRFAIPFEAMGAVTVLEALEFKRLLSSGFDPRARLMLGGYSKTGVKIAIEDANDPTPYVLISSRRPGDLARALGANRS
jgi:hypothetical protein